MKSVLKFVVMSLLVAVMSNVSFAGTPDALDDKTKITSKARNMVANASPEDWQTLSKAAETCLTKETNLEEASLWLDQALVMQKDAHTLELKGDYFALTHKAEQAVAYYIESIRVQIANGDFDTAEAQTKIKALNIELNIEQHIQAISAKIKAGDFNTEQLQREIAVLRSLLN